MKHNFLISLFVVLTFAVAAFAGPKFTPPGIVGGTYAGDVHITGSLDVDTLPFYLADKFTVDASGNVDAAGELHILNIHNTGSTQLDGKLSQSITAAGETATLGSTLVTDGDFAAADLSAWGSPANWALSSGTALHSAGSTAALTQNITVVSGSTYQVEITIDGRSAGSIAVAVGAVSVIASGVSTAFTSSVSRSVVAGATGAVAFTITPTSDFDGSVDDISVKLVTLGSVAPMQLVYDVSGDLVAEERAGELALRNSFYGLGSGRSITTGNNNSGQGCAALYSITTGSYNSGQGYAALYSLTNGSYNSGQGYNAGRYHADGSTPLQTPENSVYIGAESRGYDEADSNAIVVGYQAIGKGANTTVLGNSSTVGTYVEAGALYVDDNFTVSAEGNLDAAGYSSFGVTAGITADSGSVQGGSPLTKDYNEIATCGTSGDSVTLPAAAAGRRAIITNHGANSADVFPASGDAINEGAADAAKALAADATLMCYAYDSTNWECLTLAR